MGKLFGNNDCHSVVSNAVVLTQQYNKPEQAENGELYPVVKIKFNKLQPRYIKKSRRSAYSYMCP